MDDDDAFKLLIERAINKSGLEMSLHYVEDGEQAIRYLSPKDGFRDEKLFPFPSLVLLDLKMPRVSGFEVLQWASTRAELKNLPFVVLSSSALEKDKKQAMELGARHYFTKPMDMEGFVDIVLMVDAMLNTRDGLSSSSRITLRDSETGEFYLHPNTWTPNPDEATIFTSWDDAIARRVSLTKPKLELFVTDDRGRTCLGLRLWQGDNFEPPSRPDNGSTRSFVSS